MTIPWMMNCSHADEGWCLTCVSKMGEELAALKRARPEGEAWIPVSERLPDDDALVYLPRSKTFHIAFVSDDGNWYDPHSGEGAVFAKPDSPNGPSHWMALPESPPTMNSGRT